MRSYKYLVFHCTAGPQDQSVQVILNYWKKELGWKLPGYHELIRADGSVAELLPIEKASNGVAGFNSQCIHIATIGGVDSKGNPVDNRTEHQIASQVNRLQYYIKRFPNIIPIGHRDFSTDSNGNGIIERWEWIKSCPSYDVRDWIASMDLGNLLIPSGIIYKLNFPLIKNDMVRKIQIALFAEGYGIDIDKVFGSDTDEAVRAFQKSKGIKATGIVDRLTADKLRIPL